MRIAFLDSWLQDAAHGSGTAVAIGGLARGLMDRGHQVERLVPLGHWPRSLLWRRLWFNLTLPRRLADDRFDLYVGFDIDGVRVAGLIGRGYICSIKGVLAEESRCERGWPRLMLWLLSRLERLNARRAPLVLATSRYCSERIQADYGLSAERLAIVPEGIDLQIWSPIDDPVALAELDARRDPCTVLCVARQYPRKRVADLISAFPQVLAQFAEAQLVVIGDGPEHLALQQQVADLGIGESVQLLGALASDQEVRAWYRRATIFCLPSIQEGFGIVFLEAMASGLPVVSTTATAIPEVVPHGQAGLLVPPRDPAALATALLTLLADTTLQQGCRQFGRSHARRFSWDLVAAEFLLAVQRLQP